MAQPSPARDAMLRAWLIVSQSLAALSLGLWLLTGGFAVLALDDGVTPGAALFAGLVWGYPLFPLGCAVSAWVARRHGRRCLAAVLSTLPLAPPAVYLAWLFGA